MEEPSNRPRRMSSGILVDLIGLMKTKLMELQWDVIMQTKPTGIEPSVIT